MPTAAKTSHSLLARSAARSAVARSPPEPTHTMATIPAPRARSSTAGRSSRKSSKSRWQCESTMRSMGEGTLALRRWLVHDLDAPRNLVRGQALGTMVEHRVGLATAAGGDAHDDVRGPGVVVFHVGLRGFHVCEAFQATLDFA